MCKGCFPRIHSLALCPFLFSFHSSSTFPYLLLHYHVSLPVDLLACCFSLYTATNRLFPTPSSVRGMPLVQNPRGFSLPTTESQLLSTELKLLHTLLLQFYFLFKVWTPVQQEQGQNFPSASVWLGSSEHFWWFWLRQDAWNVREGALSLNHTRGPVSSMTPTVLSSTW